MNTSTSLPARATGGERTAASEPRLLVVVVNYRTAALTLEALRSLAGERGAVPGLRAVVVENGSGDGSAQELARGLAREPLLGWVSLLVSETNRGFAAGCNLGIATAPDARSVLLLNSDVSVHPGTLARCLAVMEADERIGAVGCRELRADGSVQTVARRFPTPLRLVLTSLGLAHRFPRLFGWADVDDPGWDRRTTARDVDWLGGAFLLLRGDVLRRVGVLDEDFFFMGEDVELCRRIGRAGRRCRYDPVAVVTHRGAGSPAPWHPGPDAAAAPSASTGWRQQQLLRARYLYLRKCHGRPAAAVVRVADLVAWGVRRLARRLVLPAGHPRRVEADSMWGLLARGRC